MTKPSSGLPREKRMSWIADKPAGQTRKRKGTVKTNPNTQTAPLSPIKGSLDIWCRSCDVTAVGRATGRTLLTPSPIMFYPDGIARTGMQRQQLLPGTHQQGFQEHGHLQAHWHGLYFQCVKAKAFNEGILLGPARPQALLVKTPRDRHVLAALCKRDYAVSQGLWCICTMHRQLPLSVRPWERSKPNKYIRISWSSSCLTLVPRAGCSAGDRCKGLTRLSKHPTSWDTCLHRRAHGQSPSANSSQYQPGKELSVHCLLCYLLNKILPH